MNELKYYYEKETETLIAYCKEVDFISNFQFKTRKWIYSSLSFMQIIHDFNLNEIKEEKVLSLTKGILPKELFYEFINIIKENKNEKRYKNGKS